MESEMSAFRKPLNHPERKDIFLEDKLQDLEKMSFSVEEKMKKLKELQRRFSFITDEFEFFFKKR